MTQYISVYLHILHSSKKWNTKLHILHKPLCSCLKSTVIFVNRISRRRQAEKMCLTYFEGIYDSEKIWCCFPKASANHVKHNQRNWLELEIIFLRFCRTLLMISISPKRKLCFQRFFVYKALTSSWLSRSFLAYLILAKLILYILIFIFKIQSVTIFNKFKFEMKQQSMS